ncbi:hypothetical protein ACE7GA_24180 [Roseomonas sp. CCTCC AB2023176]|uniref:hypothetical protein n=1 Tax=Roseomonas sp. CCTCC AB2023176 TaxID=3342640 RepID=UPI0035E2EFAC
MDEASRTGGWIVFDEGLTGRTIRLSATLRLPSDTTLDGGCRGVTITAAPRTTILRLSGVENVVVRGLSFVKEPYSDVGEPTGDAIGLAGRFDRIAILNNDFSRCGDGCVDAISDQPGETMRVLVALNRFSRHNKVMLIGSLVCSGDRRPAACAAPLDYLDGAFRPSLRLTLLANLFEETSQRHPKAISGAFVRSVANLILLRPTAYGNATQSALYGAAAASGGLLLAEGDVVVNPTATERVAAGPVSATRHRSTMDPEADGAVLVAGLTLVGPLRAVEHRPGLVRQYAEPGPVGDWVVDPITLGACLRRAAGYTALGNDLPVACAILRRLGATGREIVPSGLVPANEVVQVAPARLTTDPAGRAEGPTGRYR